MDRVPHSEFARGNAQIMLRHAFADSKLNGHFVGPFPISKTLKRCAFLNVQVVHCLPFAG
jgi:hypothetical protein